MVLGREAKEALQIKDDKGVLHHDPEVVRLISLNKPRIDNITVYLLAVASHRLLERSPA